MSKTSTNSSKPTIAEKFEIFESLETKEAENLKGKLVQNFTHIGSKISLINRGVRNFVGA